MKKGINNVKHDKKTDRSSAVSLQPLVSCRAVPEGCYEDGNCRWLNEKKFWCNKMDAPVDFNPILKLYGMACMGFGHEA